MANYLFGCVRPHHPLLWDAIEECARRLYHLLEIEGLSPENLTDADVLWATGPDVLTSVYHDRHRLDPEGGAQVVLHPPGSCRHYMAGGWRATAPRGRHQRKSSGHRVCPN